MNYNNPQLSDEEVEKAYRLANGLDSSDASRQYFLNQAKKKVKKKSGLYKLTKKQLIIISNK